MVPLKYPTAAVAGAEQMVLGSAQVLETSGGAVRVPVQISAKIAQ